MREYICKWLVDSLDNEDKARRQMSDSKAVIGNGLVFLYYMD